MPRSPSRDASSPATVQEYYRDANVRARMLEYCGATTTRSSTAVHVAGLGWNDPHPRLWSSGLALPVSQIAALWDRGCDIARSLWDTDHLVFMLDLDYQNIDEPGEPFLRPAEVFFKLEPTYRAALRLFRRWHLQTRTLATGRGYQFTAQIPLDDPIVDRLAALAPDTPAWFDGVDSRRPPDVTQSMSERQARASVGLGFLIEHAARSLLRHASRQDTIPVVVNGTIVGSGRLGRECVSIDFSHVGDPLDVRHMRAAFSAYQWHRLRPDLFGTLVADAVPPLVALPRERQSLMTLLVRGRGLEAGRRAARRSAVFLPDGAAGAVRLLEEYSASPLSAFHREFYTSRRTLAGRRPTLQLASLPPCIAASLETPNDLLLKPEHIQHLVRGLIARGWRAAQIAALVQESYEADRAWGDRWSWMDPQTRAEFDVRVFAGLIVTGLDALVDFNCVSAQEKDICPNSGCQYDLRRDRDILLTARPA
jgi:hypothetical protein